ncbi:RNA pseudouridine synthase 5 isoform X1 [Brassica napus]|uniref:RNA pseudouridine synthase 5 isoform X1 n=1 Tax=Brassica napus TaxID=3708 RepID=UPI0020785A18|nr:RNA pseudouridine synthase 5 isoform X1 [Brassica napus]
MSPQPPQRIGLPWPELNDGLTYKDVVSSSDSELRTVSDFYYSKYKSSAPLLGFYSSSLLLYSSSTFSFFINIFFSSFRWIQRIQNGQIQVDGEVVKDPNTLLRSGSKLVYHRLPWKEPDTPHSLDILYQDDHLIALNKPSGLQVLPGGLFQQRTVLTQLQWCFGESHPVPVHRLGRGTSGILLCAKTKLAKTKLSAYFAEGTSLVGSGNMGQECGAVRKISKIYRALASGIVEEDEVVIKQPIGVVRYPGVAKGLYVASSEGKPSFSKVIVLERDRQRDCTLVKVEIQSGRPHQIRIHLAYIGHPLVGDPLYVAGGQPKGVDPDLVDATTTSFAEDGGYQRPNQAVPGDCGYHLHAHEVEIPNLLNTHKVVKVMAPLPPILQTSYLAEEKGLSSCKLS